MRKTGLFKNLLTLVSGIGLAQLIGVGVQPLLRRLYSPEEFGAFAVFLSLVSILTVVASLRYEMAVVLPKKDSDGANVVVLAWIVAFLLSSLFAVLVAFFGESLMSSLKLPAQYKNWLYFVPLATFFMASYQSLNYWLIRKKSFRASSLNKVVRKASEAGVQTAGGVASFAGALPGGYIAGQIANLGVGFWQIRRNGFGFSFVRKVKILALSRRFRDFPKFYALPSLFNTSALMLPPIIINVLFDQATTGLFDLSRMLLALPLALISAALAQVLLQNIAERRSKQEKVLPTIAKTVVWLAAGAGAGTLVLFFFSEPIFAFVFGEEWRTSGTFTETLVFAYALKFIVSPLSMIFVALEKVRISAFWQFGYFLAIASLFLLKNADIQQFILYYTLIELVCYAIYALLIFGVLRSYEASLVKSRK